MKKATDGIYYENEYIANQEDKLLAKMRKKQERELEQLKLYEQQQTEQERRKYSILESTRSKQQQVELVLKEKKQMIELKRKEKEQEKLQKVQKMEQEKLKELTEREISKDLILQEIYSKKNNQQSAIPDKIIVKSKIKIDYKPSIVKKIAEGIINTQQEEILMKKIQLDKLQKEQEEQIKDLRERKEQLFKELKQKESNQKKQNKEMKKKKMLIIVFVQKISSKQLFIIMKYLLYGNYFQNNYHNFSIILQKSSMGTVVEIKLKFKLDQFFITKIFLIIKFINILFIYIIHLHYIQFVFFKSPFQQKIIFLREELQQEKLQKIEQYQKKLDDIEITKEAKIELIEQKKKEKMEKLKKVMENYKKIMEEKNEKAQLKVTQLEEKINQISEKMKFSEEKIEKIEKEKARHRQNIKSRNGSIQNNKSQTFQEKIRQKEEEYLKSITETQSIYKMKLYYQNIYLFTLLLYYSQIKNNQFYNNKTNKKKKNSQEIIKRRQQVFQKRWWKLRIRNQKRNQIRHNNLQMKKKNYLCNNKNQLKNLNVRNRNYF